MSPYVLLKLALGVMPSRPFELFLTKSSNSFLVVIFLMPLIRCRRFYCYFDIANVISNLISCKALVNYFICFMAYFLSLSPPVPF